MTDGPNKIVYSHMWAHKSPCSKMKTEMLFRNVPVEHNRTDFFTLCQSLFHDHQLLKNFCKTYICVCFYSLAYMFSVEEMQTLKGPLCLISCLGRYHRSPFSSCNRGLGVSDTHFHCVSDNPPKLIAFWHDIRKVDKSDCEHMVVMGVGVGWWSRGDGVLVYSEWCWIHCGWRLHCWHFLHESMSVKGSFAMVNLVCVLSVAILTK